MSDYASASHRAFLTRIIANIEFHRAHKFAILSDSVISRYIFEPRETRRARDYVLNASNFIVLSTTHGAISLGNPKWHNKINAKSLRAVEWHSRNEIWCGCEDLCGFRDISHLKPFHFGLVGATWRVHFRRARTVIVLKSAGTNLKARWHLDCRVHKIARFDNVTDRVGSRLRKFRAASSNQKNSHFSFRYCIIHFIILSISPI